MDFRKTLLIDDYVNNFVNELERDAEKELRFKIALIMLTSLRQFCADQPLCSYCPLRGDIPARCSLAILSAKTDTKLNAMAETISNIKWLDIDKPEV